MNQLKQQRNVVPRNQGKDQKDNTENINPMHKSNDKKGTTILEKKNH